MFITRITAQVFVSLVVMVAAALPVAAQREIEPRTPIEGMEFGGRVHTQFSSSSVDGVPSTDFRVRRARLYVGARVNDWIDGVAQVDFAAGSAEGRYMFVRGTFSPAFRVAAGQFKRAFDMFELTSSSQILVIERAGRVRGVDGCAGVGGMCSYSRMSEQLGLSSLDVGLLVDGVFAGGRGEYRASLTNGAGPNRGDENSAKSYSGRLQYVVFEQLTVGANLASHDYPNPVTTTDERVLAWALDAEWGGFEAGPHVQVGVMNGGNWAQLANDGTEASFFTWQAIVAFKSLLSGSSRVGAIEPVARLSWTDPDRDTARDSGWLVTPGIAAHLEGRNKVAANLDVWSPSEGQRAWGVLVQAYLYF